LRICLLLLLLPYVVRAQDAALSMRQRPVIAWDGDWQCAVGEATATPFPVRLPHAWSTDTRTRGAGVLWYTNQFTLSPRTHALTLQLLLIDPVGRVQAYLDDTPLETVWGNGLTRAIRLAGLGDGRHRVRLRVDAAALPPTLAGSAGLGDAVLQVEPPIRVAAVLPLPRAAQLQMTVRYRLEVDAPGPVTVLVEAFGPDHKRVAHWLGTFTLEGNVDGVAHLRVRKPEPWSPAHPRLYRVRVTLSRPNTPGDTLDCTTGFADAAFANNRLSVSGTPVILHGLRLPGGVPTNGNAWGAFSAEFTRLRQAGFNAVMADGAALPDAAYTLADRMGLLIFGDAPPGPPDAAGAYPPDTASLIAQRAHHPCVVAWSWDAATAPSSTVTTARALDPLRPMLVRNGLRSRAYGPGTPGGVAFANYDFVRTVQWDGAALQGVALDDAVLQMAQNGSAPLLMSHIALEPRSAGEAPTGARAWAVEESYLTALRAIVERVRLARAPLGFFIHPPRGGLATSDGVPTRFFTAAVAFNQPLLVCLMARPTAISGQKIDQEAFIVNDALTHGTTLRLYRQLVLPEGAVLLRKPVAITLHDNERVKGISGNLDDIAGPAGLYRLQLLLTDGATTYASARVAVQVLPKADTAAP
jgi:hypothetical protein